MPRISIGDCELYYEREGDGFPVLFITGLAGYASFWRDQVPSFARSPLRNWRGLVVGEVKARPF